MIKAMASLLIFMWKYLTGQAAPAPVVEGLTEWKGDLDLFYERALNSDTYQVSSSPVRPVVVTYFSRKDNAMLAMVIRWPNRDFYFVTEQEA